MIIEIIDKTSELLNSNVYFTKRTFHSLILHQGFMQINKINKAEKI